MDESLLDQLIEDSQKPKEVDFSKFGIIAFTDGSCIGKGEKSGGSGVYFHAPSHDDLHQIKILEHLPKSELLYMDLANTIIFNGNETDFEMYCDSPNCINIGYASAPGGKRACSKHKLKESKIIATYVKHPPTNIRAEGKAIILAINAVINKLKSQSKLDQPSIDGVNITSLELHDHQSEDKLLIVTDSKFWIDLVTEWLAGWIAKRKIMERANIDLIVKILIARNQLAELGVKLEFLHVYGHQDKKKENLSFQEKGNVIADKLATHASAMARHGIFLLK